MAPDEREEPSVADEAAKLAQAFSAWSRQGPAGGSERSHGADASDAAGCGCSHGDSVQAVCRMCPLCRAAGLLQAVQPDLLDRVADLLSVVAGGLHSAAEQRRAGDGEPHGED